MSHSSTSVQPSQTKPELKGSQVCLRPIVSADLSKIRQWKSDPVLCRMILTRPATLSQEDMVTWYQRNSQDPNQVFLGIYLNEPEMLIGIVRLMFIDWTCLTAEFGTYIGESDLQGKKLGREATLLMLDHAFHTLQLRKVYVKIGEANPRALKVYESLGFKREGILREQVLTDEGYQNVVFLGIFKHEYDPK